MWYYAHSTDSPDKQDWQHLEDHLVNVAETTARFASSFGVTEYGYVAGLLHDLGKYSGAFQRRLEGAPDRVDHSTAGAREARALYPGRSRLLEYVIAGHHTGLQDFGTPLAGLDARLRTAEIENYSAYRGSISPPATIDISSSLGDMIRAGGFSSSFLVRMLFSSIVDADSLDTERFADPLRATERGQYDALDVLAERLNRHLDSIARRTDGSAINQCRRAVLARCREMALREPGLYTLTVPTGGGKTLSSMAFALDHMRAHGLERVIYVLPYTSIIEQNAAVFREIFGERNVLEHHSNFDPVREGDSVDDAARQLPRTISDNWDIPIVVTTNVQFFESLFASRRSRCRKIHNLAKSVIVLDEAQMIPTAFLKPSLAAVTELVRHYGSTVVVCTATQPALDGLLGPSVRPVELVASPGELYERLRRVEVHDLGAIDDVALLDELHRHQQALCIVNTRAHALNLARGLAETGPVFHLSGTMCPVHRRRILAEVRTLLKDEAPCRVVSTQLIEAGVDIDFPVVYRAMTGVDSLAQAAGRCNREGRLQRGHVNVFTSTERHGRAPGWLSRVAEVGEMIVRESADPLSLESVDRYFQRLYHFEGDRGLDRKEILPLIEERWQSLAFPFEEIGSRYQLIEDGAVDIVVPYDARSRRMIAALRSGAPPGAFLRRLQGYVVSVYTGGLKRMERAGAVELIGERVRVLTDPSLYSEDVGLVLPDAGGTTFELLTV